MTGVRKTISTLPNLDKTALSKIHESVLEDPNTLLILPDADNGQRKFLQDLNHQIIRIKSLAAFCKPDIKNNFSQVKNPESEGLLLNLHVSISV